MSDPWGGRSAAAAGAAGMLIDNPPDPLRRVRRPDRLPQLLRRVAVECDLGTVYDHRVAELGYDDCNVVLRTDRGSYVVKVFSRFRTPAMCDRYAAVLAAVLAAGVRHPPLHPGGDGELLIHDPDTGDACVVMDFVDGETFLEMGDHPRPSELRTVVEQVHRVHTVELVPDPVYDWWAIPQLPALAAEVGPLLHRDDRARVEAAAQALAAVDTGALPHVLAHGDLTKANVMRSRSGDIAIIDFAVANRYPRVLDLAMMAVNLMHGDPVPLPERATLLTELYQTFTPLAGGEREALPAYVCAAAAMELLGATREWVVKGNRGQETRYLLSLGRSALRAAVG